jgi:hypothetical protein
LWANLHQENALFTTFDSSTAVDSDQVTTQNDEYLIEELIRQIQAGHESAACQLREFMARGVRWYLRRNARDEKLDEAANQVLDRLIFAIKKNEVNNLSALTAFTRNAVRVFTAAPSVTGAHLVPADPARVANAKRALYEFNEPEREALVRYFEGQLPSRICADLGMTDEALSALRGRLRARCSELGSNG